MIVVRLIGGLGNQMFQYAFAKELAFLFDDVVFLDCGGYEKYKVRGFSLDKLSIPSIRFIEQSGLTNLAQTKLRFQQESYRGLQKAIKLVRRNDRVGGRVFKAYAKRGLYYNFDPYYYGIPENRGKTRSVYGYFQGESYFKDVEETIRREFVVSVDPSRDEESLLSLIDSCNSVGVSIRCGHGYRGSALDVCSPDYYYQGTKSICATVSDPVFFIFSDDIDYVKQNYSFEQEVIYISGFADYQSLRLLCACKHFVIANSTFSWWGSFLGSSEEKVIVAPRRWRKTSSGTPDIYSSKFDYLI